VVAVVGDNGAGKSTLLALAARLIDPDAGSVSLNGRDVRDVTLASLRRAVGIAGPDMPLLRGDVESNLRYRWPDAPVAELERVRRLTDLDDVLADLPQGTATRLAERGAGLSSGQQARVALARALVGDPPLLLLDEVEAHLDSGAAAIVDRVLADRRGRATTIVVTHRSEIIAAADVVWQLSQGRLVATPVSGNGRRRVGLQGQRDGQARPLAGGALHGQGPAGRLDAISEPDEAGAGGGIGAADAVVADREQQAAVAPVEADLRR
jgi:ABC-type multidrug transport system fused ATPase/permease subunit